MFLFLGFVFFLFYYENFGFQRLWSVQTMMWIFEIFVLRITIVSGVQFLYFVWLIGSLLIFVWFVDFFLFGSVESLILDVYNIFRSQALNNSWFFLCFRGLRWIHFVKLWYIYFTSICPLSIFWGFWSPFNFLVILFALDSFSLRSLELLCMQLLSLYSP